VLFFPDTMRATLARGFSPATRRRRLALAAGFAAIVGLVSCKTLDDNDSYQRAQKATGAAVHVAAEQTAKAARIASDQATKALARMQHYLAEKDLLKTFHDAGNQSETVLLNVLHKKGAGAAAPAPPAPAPTPGTPPPKQPKRPTPAPGSPPAEGSAVPDHYAGTLRWPVDAGIVSSEYGKRWGKLHKGIDIAADVGEPLYAVAAGVVIYAGNTMRGYGNAVILKHDRERTTLYAHSSELKVQEGDVVAQGAVVALLGNTGHSTGPHVHFEIRDLDTAVDPRAALPPSPLAGLELDAHEAEGRRMTASALSGEK
jgi:murein DD-endopeptidase MepM/ murein hydrolase activator NlpD